MDGLLCCDLLLFLVLVFSASFTFIPILVIPST